MRRLMRLFTVGCLVVAFASYAAAENANQRLVGKKGIGYYSSEAPLGVRYWMSDAMAVDVGVGLDMATKADNPNTPSAVEDETLFNWAFDVGLPFVLHGEENMIVYFRPGITLVGDNVFDSSATAQPNDKVYDIAFAGGLSLGGEFFLGQFGWPNLSFSGQIGVNFNVVSPGASGAESTFNFGSTFDDVSIVDTGSLGFHIYF